MTTRLLSRPARAARTTRSSRNGRTGRTLVGRTAAVAAAAALGLGLAACSDDEVSQEEANAHAASVAEEAVAELNQSAEAADPSSPESTPPNDPGAPQISADKTQALTDGETITVTVRGLDTSGGYYLGICKAGTGADAAGQGGAPDCTGEMSDSRWLTAEGSEQGTDHFDADGDADVELTVAAQGDAVDCTTDKCVLKVFGDHTNAFRAVGEAPVSFAA